MSQTGKILSKVVMPDQEHEKDAVHTELETLRIRFDRNSHGHLTQALRLQYFNYWATFITTIGGVIAMALGAALLTSADANYCAVVSITVVSSIITLIGVMQAVWKPGERSLRHQGWGARFAALEQDCESTAKGLGSKTLQQIIDDEREISSQVDLVPESIWDIARRKRKKEKGE
jgi:hypothetical protein